MPFSLPEAKPRSNMWKYENGRSCLTIWDIVDNILCVCVCVHINIDKI